MDSTEAPQILEHANKTLNFTPFDVRWIPASARFVLLGQSPGAKGIFKVMQLEKGDLKEFANFDKEFGIKDATFKASSIAMRDVACVDFKGRL